MKYKSLADLILSRKESFISSTGIVIHTKAINANNKIMLRELYIKQMTEEAGRAINMYAMSNGKYVPIQQTEQFKKACKKYLNSHEEDMVKDISDVIEAYYDYAKASRDDGADLNDYVMHSKARGKKGIVVHPEECEIGKSLNLPNTKEYNEWCEKQEQKLYDEICKNTVFY